ncbi:MAG: methyl-accepting chemotaxis protein [Devosiaceae bacterium]
MARMMLNVTIYTRIMVLCLIPMLALIGLGFVNLAEERDRKNQSLFIGEAVTLAPSVSNLVHELQKERGMSAGFIGSGGQSFADVIGDQRLLTDEQLSLFQTTFSDLAAGLDIPIITAPLDEARAALEQLRDRRTAVDSLSISVGDMAGYYTPLITDLLGVVESITTVIDDGTMLRPVLSYIGLLQGKERAGIERAMGAAGFGSGTFAQPVYRNFIRLGAMQDVFFARFRQYATAEEIAYFEQQLAGTISSNVAELRALATAAPYGGDISSVTGPQWFAISTARIDALKAVEDQIAAGIAGTAYEAANAASTAFWALAGMLAALIMLTALVCYFVAKSIAPPIRRLAKTMRALAANNINISVGETWRTDEVGDMAKAVETFRENAIDRLELEKKAHHDRDHERARQAHIEKIVQSFRGQIDVTSEEVSGHTDNMRGLAERLLTVAQTAAEDAQSAHSASTGASSNVQTVAAATEELSASIREISGQTHKVSSLMDAAAQRADATNTDVAQLSNAADHIGTVIGLISDIAEQTNLLALNATIEAARAGDAGRGFAVVASEVKELATQTAKATEEIGQQIAGIQTSTSGTVDSIVAITQAINEIRELTTSIAGAVEQQEAATQEIANSVGAASSGTETAASNVASVSQSIENTASEANTVNETADKLAGTAGGLLGQIEAFLVQVSKDVEDRRGAIRDKMSECVLITSAGRRRRTKLMDASTSGAKLALVDGVDVGDQISMEMADGITLTGTVRRLADGGAGIEFDQPIEDPQALVGKGNREPEAA